MSTLVTKKFGGNEKAPKQERCSDVLSDLLVASAAKSQLAAMLNNGNLREIFGSEIAGIPTETVLAITQAHVWGGGAIF